jgi:hypothetical protein
VKRPVSFDGVLRRLADALSRARQRWYAVMYLDRTPKSFRDPVTEKTVTRIPIVLYTPERFVVDDGHRIMRDQLREATGWIW